MSSSPWFADKPGWSQLCLGIFFISPPPIGERVLPLRKAVLSPLQDTDVILNSMSVIKRPSHKGRHTFRVVTKNYQRHIPPPQDFCSVIEEERRERERKGGIDPIPATESLRCSRFAQIYPTRFI